MAFCWTRSRLHRIDCLGCFYFNFGSYFFLPYLGVGAAPVAKPLAKAVKLVVPQWHFPSRCEGPRDQRCCFAARHSFKDTNA
jgi:hypothetical protein